MKNWMLALAVAASLGTAAVGCGVKTPPVTWKETTGTVLSSVDKGDGTCITQIEYTAGATKLTTTHMGSKTANKGQSVKIKYDEANPGSIQSIEGL